MKLEISLTNDNNSFKLSPIDFELDALRGIGVYVNYLNGGKVDNGIILIPINGADTIDLYHKIVSLFENRFGCIIVKDKTSNEMLSNAESEEKRFQEFSQKALRIRNNEIDKSELEGFLNIIQKKEFKRTLKPFQLLSAYHLAFSQNACNFSVPGSGKTTTVLAAYSYLKTCQQLSKRVDKILIVGPLASFIAWKKEYYYCFGEKPESLEITGATSDSLVEKSLLRKDVHEDVILISYGSVNRRLDTLVSFLQANPCMVVLDEAHRIKNTDDGVQSQSTLCIAPYAKSRVVLTGTPAPNGYEDLYNLYKFIWPSHNVIGYSVIQLANMGKRDSDYRLKDLLKRIAPYYIRIKKSDLGLPKPIFHNPVKVKMSPLQEKIYTVIAKIAVGKLEQSSQLVSSRLAAIIRLRQAATNPSLLNKGLEEFYENGDDDFSIPHNFDDTLDFDDEIKKMVDDFCSTEIPKKYIATGELIKEIVKRKEKVIVWCEFVGTCIDLGKYLESIGVKNKLLYGGTTLEEREIIIDEFVDEEQESSFNVIIANPHAVGESISLHATCHNAIYIEQSFNAGTYMQSKDRIHRVGLNESDNINYYFIHSCDTIDETVLRRLKRKESRMLALVESQEIPLISANKDFLEDDEDDIKAVIRDYYEFRNKHI